MNLNIKSQLLRTLSNYETTKLSHRNQEKLPK